MMVLVELEGERSSVSTAVDLIRTRNADNAL